jgi:hypothetical protein
MTAIAREDLVIDGSSQLRWFTSASGDAGARRGFCGRCGSSLFCAGDYYEVPADGTPHHPLGR